MRGVFATAVVVVALACAWVGVSGQQEARVRPGLGSGIVDVRGTVSVSSVPPVSIDKMPALTTASHVFLKPKTSYLVLWPEGDREDITVLETAAGGWVRVSPRRWINLDGARAVEVR